MASKPLNFPAPINQAYNGAVSNVRTTLNEWQAKITKSPGFKNELMAQLTVFITANA
ncbi:hypothetical protein CPT_Paso_053 [Rhizobium phage Paso]|uniref:Uncharacterized protein n=1 Tax=Rhizobium phage Paso TaxID=2767574 RepID=A0A7L8G6Q4_9CAUD|nr:hypothetical protein CPT_Paso_053 [Rhizobium phage Paso]